MGREVVYMHWLSKRTCYIRGADLLIALGPNDGYYYNVSVKPPFRGQRIGRTAQQQFLAVAAAEAIGHLIAYVERNNRVSRYILTRLGYEVVTKVRSFRAFGLRIGNYYDARMCTMSRRIMNSSEQRHYWI
jgi:RimJ/RimL family protein N-acetyltransferase